MYELLKEFIMPELLALAPVLYLVGAGLKRSGLADRRIPAVLGLAGVLLAAMYTAAAGEFRTARDVLAGAFAALTQGVLCAGASVYLHQLKKQAGKCDEEA